MDNAEYVFHQTSRERGRLGRNAYAKVNGCRSRKCTMPSDRLTAKQRKELNGKVATYDMKSAWTWEQFRKAPHDIQTEYLETLWSRGLSRGHVLAMFGIKSANFSTYLANNLPGLKVYKRGCGNPPAGEELPEEVSQPVEEEKAPQNESGEVKQATPDEFFTMKGGVLHFEGDPRAVFEKMLLTIDPSKRYFFTINFGEVN